MISKRTITVSIIIILSLLLTGLATFTCLLLFVPQYVESRVIPSALKESGIEISSLKVRSIGLSGAEISDIKIGPANNEGLKVDSIRLDYSILGLLGRRIDNLALSGISININYVDNRLSITGLDNLTSDKTSDSKKSNTVSKPFTVNNLSVTSSKLLLHVNKKKLIIPFDFFTAAFNQNKLPEKFSLRIYPGSHEMSVAGSIDNNENTILNLTSTALSLDIFEDILSGLAPLDIEGKADIELSANLSQRPVSLTDLSASCRLNKTVISYQKMKLRNPAISNSSEKPIILQIESKDLNHYEYSASPVLIDTKPFPVMLEISGSADLSENIQKGKIKAVTRIMTGDDSPEMKWDISAERQGSSEKYKAVINGKTNTENEKATPIKTRFDNMLLTAFSPELNIQAEYSGGSFSGSYLFNIKDIETTYNEMSFSIPAVSINGTMNDMGNIFNTESRISFKNGSLSMLGDSLNANKISANIPFSYPFSKVSQKGSLSINKIRYENYSLGPVNIDILQKGSDIPFSGAAKFPALPDMAINISGNAAIEPFFDNGKIKIDIPQYNPSSQIDLGRFSPALKGFYYKGNLTGKTDIHFSNSDFVSGLDLKIDNGTIENMEKKLRFENLSLDLKLEDLVSIKSPFGQRLKVASISFGDIKADDFILDFKIDGPSLLFIEKGSFKWCGGRVNIQSFRLNPDKKEYDLTLFCDRIKLAEILAQFGVANASGGGSVNGKLPIKISNNKISFEDGFLYSTPGGGGKISITETDILTKGLDPDSAEYAQMDIAREALKAFDYTWVKMSFETEKDDLALKLQFDGKPENKLPFRYSENEKKFIRINNDAEGTEFKGIGLDVNFRVPVDEILNIKDALDMME